MMKNLSIFLVLLSQICSFCGAYASDDITAPDFTINVGAIDPTRPNQDLGTAVGVGAATHLLNQISNLLIFIIPIIAGVALIIAGYYYILSSGDSEKASRAKQIIKWNAVAILISLFSYVIVRGISYLLAGSL